MPRERHARELDRQLEELAYLKIWQGVFLVTDVSLIGWLVAATRGDIDAVVVLAVVGAVLLNFAIFRLHRDIERHLKLIGAL